ncbi:MAG: UDP-glucose/iron transport system ATP-binding protein [Candidatus Atribacteria bacterium]|nr:UDP-glucose/iron transport system ATP-binding protein [Candidatus Atribacteria bacterium]
MQTVFDIRNLTRVVDGEVLLDGISVSIKSGEILAVVGPSGSGKTSFLRLLNRLDEPTGGEVFFQGKDYRTIPTPFLRQKVGLVFQKPALFPGTVADNIRWGPSQRGEEMTNSQVESLLTQVGLVGFAERKIDNLSGGEAQRVALARTLANSPEILLLDEPTSALDEEKEREIERLLLTTIDQRRLTLVLVTHNLAQARRLATRVMVLNHGKITFLGPKEEALHVKPSFLQ